MATLGITKSDPNGYASLGYAAVIIYPGVILGSGTVTSFGLHVLDKVGVAVANHGTLNASTVMCCRPPRVPATASSPPGAFLARSISSATEWMPLCLETSSA